MQLLMHGVAGLFRHGVGQWRTRFGLSQLLQCALEDTLELVNVVQVECQSWAKSDGLCAVGAHKDTIVPHGSLKVHHAMLVSHSRRQ